MEAASQKKLSALESCGFIRKYKKYGKKSKESIYQIIDNFTLFYYKFLKRKPTDTNFWINHLGSSSYRTWCGLSFEIVCLEHVDMIKKKLGISGVYTDTYTFQCKEDQDKGINGSQIDLLIDRADNIIDLCEIKYAKSTYKVTKDDAMSLANKVDDFIKITNVKKPIHIILITTFGLTQSIHSNDISYVITLDDLFQSR